MKLTRDARRRELLDKRRSTRESRMAKPSGDSNYARKIRNKGRTFGQPEVVPPPVILSPWARYTLELERQKEARRHF